MTGGVIPPSTDELKEIAKQYRFTLDDEQAKWFQGLIDGSLASYRRLAQLPDDPLEVKYPRTPGYTPDAAENPYRAWQRKCAIKGADSGKLAGKKIAVKDPILVAGIPTAAGSAVVQNFVPDIDATVVTRILDAGGEIVGKATCEDLCLSGGSVGSIPEPVRNPVNPQYSAGGSSSGCAALMAADACDMTLGADQGGSIRLPAAQCGVVGLKPTYGLVPYTGILPLENSLDHCGPLCKTVADTALLLEVVAGRDSDRDPRQTGEIRVQEYTKALTGDAKGLKIGVVKEGFGWAKTMGLGEVFGDAVECDAVVRDAAMKLEKAGASVKEISVPMHLDGPSIYTPLFIEGIGLQVFFGNGFLVGHKGYHPTGAITAFGRARKAEADNYSDLCKLTVLMGHYMNDRYQGRYYAKAQNLSLKLKRAYDAALSEYDVLVMPTLAPAGRALKITEPATPDSYLLETFNYHVNACPFDATGHPSLSVPCGKVSGLPVGLMVIGKHFDDATVLRVGHAVEQLGLYKKG
jgi:amidase